MSPHTGLKMIHHTSDNKINRECTVLSVDDSAYVALVAYADGKVDTAQYGALWWAENH